MVLKTVQFLAVVLTALALASSAVLLSALPHEIGVLQDTYYVVQRGYGGWPQIGALIANAALAVLVRSQPVPFWLAVVGFMTIAATLAIFILWIPQWITVPDNNVLISGFRVSDWWRQWDYGHAANAILTFIGLCAVTCSVLSIRK
jgi:hypothetical protein